MSLFPFMRVMRVMRVANQRATPKQKLRIATLLRIGIYLDAIAILVLCIDTGVRFLHIGWKSIHSEANVLPILAVVLGIAITLMFLSSIMVFVSASQIAKNTSGGYRSKRVRRRSAKKIDTRTLSFSDGVASILDFGNTLAPSMPGLTGRQKDYLALRSDWAAVGDDLQVSIKNFNENVNKKDDEVKVGRG